MTTHLASEPWHEECRFWLHGGSEVSYGRLDYHPRRGPGAHLLDTPLGGRNRLESPERLAALHGESLGGVPFSLLDAWVTGGHRYHGNRRGNTVDVLGTTLVRRAHVASTDEVSVTEARLEVQGLLEAVTGGVVDSPPLFAISATADAHDALSVALPLASLTLHVGAGESIARHTSSVTLGAAAHIKLEAGPVPLAEFDQRYAGPLRDLVMFATAEPSWIESLRVADLSRIAPEDSWAQHAAEIEVVRRPPVEAVPKTSASYYALMLNLGAVPDPSATIVEWFSLRDQLGPVWPLFFATLERTDLPLENRLMNLAGFAEGYHRALHDEPPLETGICEAETKDMLAQIPDAEHRRVYREALLHANSQTLRERAAWLARRAVGALDQWPLDAEAFGQQISQTRNWFAHLGTRAAHVQAGEDLVRLVHRVELVLRANLMLDIGLDERTVANNIASGMRLVSSWP